MTSHTVPNVMEPLLAFQVRCPNGHVVTQKFTIIQIRAGSMRFSCCHCGCFWTSSCATEARLLRAMTLHHIGPAQRWGSD